MGLCPITHVEITAWEIGMQLGLTPFERKAIRAVDEAYMTHALKQSKEQNEREH